MNNDDETRPWRTESAWRSRRATPRGISETSSPSGKVSATIRRRCRRERNASPDRLAGPQQHCRRGDRHVGSGRSGLDRTQCSVDRCPVGHSQDFVESRYDPVDRRHAGDRGSRDKPDQLTSRPDRSRERTLRRGRSGFQASEPVDDDRVFVIDGIGLRIR